MATEEIDAVLMRARAEIARQDAINAQREILTLEDLAEACKAAQRTDELRLQWFQLYLASQGETKKEVAV